MTEPAPQYQQALTLINLSRFEEARIKLKAVIEKFPKSRFNSLASLQLKKISDELRIQSTAEKYRTEVIKDPKTIESPNF